MSGQSRAPGGKQVRDGSGKKFTDEQGIVPTVAKYVLFGKYPVQLNLCVQGKLFLIIQKYLLYVI